MTFIDVLFPTDISQGTAGGPTFNTLVTVTGSGVEQRAALWRLPRYKWDVAYTLKKPEQMYDLTSLFNLVQGRLDSFRFLDWSDYHDYRVGSNTPMGYLTPTPLQPTKLPCDGTSPLQMYKSYAFGSYTKVRKISKPITGTIIIRDGSGNALVEGGMGSNGYTIDYTSGVVTLESPSTYNTQQMTWSGQFHIHARFDVDEMKFVQEATTIRSIDSINIVEIRD